MSVCLIYSLQTFSITTADFIRILNFFLTLSKFSMWIFQFRVGYKSGWDFILGPNRAGSKFAKICFISVLCEGSFGLRKSDFDVLKPKRVQNLKTRSSALFWAMGRSGHAVLHLLRGTEKLVFASNRDGPPTEFVTLTGRFADKYQTLIQLSLAKSDFYNFGYILLCLKKRV